MLGSSLEIWEIVIALIILSPFLVTAIGMTYTFLKTGYEDYFLHKSPQPAVLEMNLLKYIQEVKTSKDEFEK